MWEATTADKSAPNSGSKYLWQISPLWKPHIPLLIQLAQNSIQE